MRFRVLTGVLALLSLFGCEGLEDPLSRIPGDFTTDLDPGIEQVLTGFQSALEESDSEAYLALLHDDFRYQGSEPFPWAPGDGTGWALEDERIIATNFATPGWIPFGATSPAHLQYFEILDPRDYQREGALAQLTIELRIDMGTLSSGSDMTLHFQQSDPDEWRIVRIESLASSWSRFRAAFHDEPSLDSEVRVQQALRTVIARRDASTYAKLLAPADAVPGFLFHPRPEDLPAMGWLVGDSWGRDEEIDLMDRLLAGTPTEDGTLESLALDIWDIESTSSSGGIWSYQRWSIQVRRSGTATTFYRTYLTLHLVPDDTGELRIHELWETSPSGWEAGESWGLQRSEVRAAPPIVGPRLRASSRARRSPGGIASRVLY